ncbi:hypothetical protein GGF46_004885 [Coemansia sp. RSA 552]|nr:hypothetical protein GGF46_004885 [Coemansia sp. RSA 552]
MKSATAIMILSSLLAMSRSQPMDAGQICNKACQVAPTDQHDTCMRVCTQFAVQGAGLASPIGKADQMSTVSAKSSASPAPSSASESQAAKSHGEDNDEDHESESGSSSASGSATSAAAAAGVNSAMALAVALAAGAALL